MDDLFVLDCPLGRYYLDIDFQRGDGLAALGLCERLTTGLVAGTLLRREDAALLRDALAAWLGDAPRLVPRPVSETPAPDTIVLAWDPNTPGDDGGSGAWVPATCDPDDDPAWRDSEHGFVLKPTAWMPFPPPPGEPKS